MEINCSEKFVKFFKILQPVTEAFFSCMKHASLLKRNLSLVFSLGLNSYFLEHFLFMWLFYYFFGALLRNSLPFTGIFQSFEWTLLLIRCIGKYLKNMKINFWISTWITSFITFLLNRLILIVLLKYLQLYYFIFCNSFCFSLKSWRSC